MNADAMGQNAAAFQKEKLPALQCSSLMSMMKEKRKCLSRLDQEGSAAFDSAESEVNQGC